MFKRDYFAGIETNLKLMKKFYGSDWIMRLFYQISKSSPTWKRLCSLVCQDPNIDICNAEDNPMYGKFGLNFSFLARLREKN